MDAMKLATDWVKELEKDETLEIENEVINTKYKVLSWLIQSEEEIEKAPPDVKNNIIWIAEDFEYPIKLRYVEPAGAFALSNKDECLVGILVASKECTNFAASRGVAKKMRGQELNGKVFDTDSPALFHVRLAVENPIDWLVLLGLGLPACWGIWGGGSSDIPFQSPPLTIPCIINIALGPNKEDTQTRFRDNLSNKWLPRELMMRKFNSLLNISKEERTYIKNQIMIKSQAVEV